MPIFIPCIFSLHAHAAAYDTIRVSSFGAMSNSRKNAVPAIQKALQTARNVQNPLLIFDDGRYDFWPQHAAEKEYFESNTTDNNPKRLGMLIENFDRLTVEGSGAMFVFHDRMQPVTIDHSSKITTRNFSIDWDIPLTAEAEVMEIEDNFALLRIDRCQFPYVIENGVLTFVGEGWKSAVTSVMEIQHDTHLIEPYTGDPGCCGWGWDGPVAEEIEPGVVRINKAFGLQRPDKGNILILRHSARDHAGIFLFHSKDIEVSKVNVYHTAGLGILSQYSENITIDQVNMVPNPAKKRYLSGHDDGLHFSNCKGQIVVTNCRFAALMDDPVNIHGTSVRIIKKLAPNKLLCHFMHHQSVGLQWARPGETIGFIGSATMETVAHGIVKDFLPLNKEDFEITFQQDIPSAIHTRDALENLTWTPDAYIANNRFMSCRARGLLVTTPGKVVIENNYFESSGSAILIAGDANNWYETGAVKDVLIQKNIFADPCLTSLYQFSEAIISIYPEIPSLTKSTPTYHRNIRIIDNEFHPFDYPLLYAKSVDGLTFQGNSILRSHRFKPFHPRKYTLSLAYCKHVLIAGNSYSKEVLGRNVLLENMPKKDVKIEKSEQLEIIKKDR